MVAAFAGIFQILVKMWEGGHSLSGGPGSRGGSWRRRRASQGHCQPATGTASSP